MSDQINMGTQPEPKSAGPNDAALAAKFDKGNEPPVNAKPDEKPQRPEHIPEKFWDADKGEVNVEAMAKSYAELEKSKSGKKADEPAPAAKEGEQTPPVNEVKDALKEAGLNFDDYNAEIVKDGKLSEGSYKALAEKGYTKEIVDVYVAGLNAQAAVLTNAAHEGAGGAEQFAEMQKWASENVSEAELDAYNSVLETGDPAKIKLAVQGLANKFAEAEGRPAQRQIDGGGNAPAPGDVYSSVDQMKADMRDPRYQTDPAFRAQVAEKLGRSKIM